MINIINQLFEIEKKIQENDSQSIQRNVDRIKHELESMGYIIVNPMGKPYDERDASIEANISSEKPRMVISKVLKPAIYYNENDIVQLIQKAIVIVS